MIEFIDAKAKARNALNQIEGESGIALTFLEENTLSFEYGWVFFYQSKEFVETQNPGMMIGGNAPILVDKYDGNVFFTGTRKDIEEYIEIFSKFKTAWLA